MDGRDTWTDESLDDLSRRMQDRFNRVDEDMRLLRSDLGGRIDRLDGRIDALQRTMIQVGGGTIAAILATLITLIATQV